MNIFAPKLPCQAKNILKQKLNMKNLFGILIMALFAVSVNAQINTPAASPKQMVKQTVGLTDITVEYSRPSMKGRTIFAEDGLVSYGKMWRTGANAATKITFSTDVTVNGKALEAGSYAITTVPSANEWRMNFYPYVKSSWSSYAEANPVLSVTTKPKSLGMSMESFLIHFGNLKDDSASLDLMWDKTVASVKIGVSYDEEVMAAIEKTLAGPTPNDYYNAASYYHSSGKDLNKALEYVRKATNVAKPRYWQVRREALILADMGKTDEAIKAANKSLELAKAAGNEDYVKMNQKSINEWVAGSK